MRWQKLCAVCKEFFQDNAIRVIKSANGRPLLYTFSSYGTPLHTTEHISAKLPGGGSACTIDSW